MVAVGFSRTSSFISRIIRWVTKSSVSHAFIVFTWLNEKWALEASFSGVIITPFSSFTKDNVIVKIVHLDNVHLADLRPALMCLGQKYDFGGLFGHIWIQVGKWLRLRWHNPLQNSKALFCSELVVEQLLKPIGWPGAEELQSRDVNPDDLLHFLDNK